MVKGGSNAYMHPMSQVCPTMPPPQQAMVKGGGEELTGGSNANMHPRPQDWPTMPPPQQFATPDVRPSCYQRLHGCFQGWRCGSSVYDCYENSPIATYLPCDQCYSVGDMLSAICAYLSCDQCYSVGDMLSAISAYLSCDQC